MKTALLEVKNLSTRFQTEDGDFFAVDDVSFRLQQGKTLGIVGESGCGKSVTSLSLMRLIEAPGKIISGQILFQGKNLIDLSDDEIRKIRGNKIAMIFQEPMTSLNPVYSCGNQIEEVICLHRPELDAKSAKKLTLEMLNKVGIPDPSRIYNSYPHQLSGGLRQRIMIAMAMSCDPQLLIADEPTTALDVTIQAQILELIRKLQTELGTGMILITHDLGVVAEMCDDVAVMYAGQIVEYGSVDDIFYNTQHPYTQGLIHSIPRAGQSAKRTRLRTIPGIVPNMLRLPPGCRFSDRCDRVQEICRKSKTPLLQIKPDHQVACLFPLGSANE